MKVLKECVETVKQFGLWRGIFDIIYRVNHRLFGVMILNVVVLEADALNASSLENPFNYELSFIDGPALRALAAKYPDAITEGFIETAFAKGDLCFGVLDQEKLTSFGWYSQHETPIDDYLSFAFNPDHIYMYKGYTVPHYRGQKLHALGMAHALLEFHERGAKGITAYIEANNFRSQSSCERLGYKQIGQIFICKIFSRYISLASPGCRKHGVYVRQRAARTALKAGEQMSNKVSLPTTLSVPQR